MINKNKYVNNTQWTQHGLTTSKQWAFVSVLGAYFSEILKYNGFLFKCYLHATVLTVL